MAGAIFLETLWRGWRTAAYWAVGLGVLFLFSILVVPNVDALNQYKELMETLPSFVLSMVGTDDLQSIATPEGFLNLAQFSTLPLLLGVYVVAIGMNISVGEEDDGIMDVLLAHPVPRWRVLAERFGAYGVLITGVLLGMFAVGLFSQLINAIAINWGSLLLVTLTNIPIALLILAVTMFSGAVFRRKSQVLAFSAVFLLGSYFLDVLGRAASNTPLGALRGVSFLYYYDSEKVLFNGLNPLNVGVVLVVSAVLFVASLWLWQRRDVGV